MVRRPLPGETAETAHNVLREYRVVDALHDTDVPVPTTVAACEAYSIIRRDFYVMERERVDVLRDNKPERFAQPERRQKLDNVMFLPVDEREIVAVFE